MAPATVLPQVQVPDEEALRKAFEAALSEFFPEPEPPVSYDGFGFSTKPQDNVIGVGIGTKIKNGVSTRLPCISLYLERKLPSSAVPKQYLLPPAIQEVQTDVIDSGGRFEPFQEITELQRRSRPALPGCSVGVRLTGSQSDFVMAGTLGAVVESDGRRHVLSNNHVLANVDSLPVGTPVFQPGPADGGQREHDEIAYLSRFAPLNDGAPFSVVDCALAELIQPSFAVMRFPPQIGQLSGAEAIPAQVGMRVGKVGRTTGFTEGVVVRTGFACKIDYRNRRRRFKDQILIEKGPTKGFFARLGFGAEGPFSYKGDSGALIIDLGTRKAIGLLCGGSRVFTIANQLSAVFLQLKVRLAI